MVRCRRRNSANAADRDALKLAIAQSRAEDEGRRWQIDAKLKDEPWEDVATFAAYSRQCHTLHLKPWQVPPCWVEVDDPPPQGTDYGGHREAQRLLREMLDLGISQWHPDPLAAIEAAKAKHKHKLKAADPIARCQT
jgi:hypothetical protein